MTTALSEHFLLCHFGKSRSGYDWPVRHRRAAKPDDGISIPPPPQPPAGFQHVGGVRFLAINLDIEPGDFDEENFAERGLRMLPFVTVSFFVILIGACLVAAVLR